MPYVRCKSCTKKFYVKPSWLKNGWGKYCSRNCRQEVQKTGKIINCHICGKTVYKSGTDLKNSKSRKYFCNKSCQTIWRNTIEFIGSRHANWKGGSSTEGYRNVLKRSGRIEVCDLCKTKDKRILAVHHVDKDRSNNRSENLAWLCHNCHFLVHHYQEEKSKFMADVA